MACGATSLLHPAKRGRLGLKNVSRAQACGRVGPIPGAAMSYWDPITLRRPSQPGQPRVVSLTIFNSGGYWV